MPLASRRSATPERPRRPGCGGRRSPTNAHPAHSDALDGRFSAAHSRQMTVGIAARCAHQPSLRLPLPSAIRGARMWLAPPESHPFSSCPTTVLSRVGTPSKRVHTWAMLVHGVSAFGCAWVCASTFRGAQKPWRVVSHDAPGGRGAHHRCGHWPHCTQSPPSATIPTASKMDAAVMEDNERGGASSTCPCKQLPPRRVATSSERRSGHGGSMMSAHAGR